MLEEIQSWNVLTQLVSGGLLFVTIMVILALIFARNNTPIISETQQLLSDQDNRSSLKIIMYMVEHEAHQINDAIDDKKEAERLSRID